MIQIPAFSFFFFVLFTLAQAQQADSLKKLPPLLEEKPSLIDMQHIVIDLQFDWAKKQAYGKTTLTFSLLSATEQIALDAGNLTIHSIQLNNKTPLAYQYEGGDKNESLIIFLGKKYKAHEKITIEIVYNTNYVNLSDPNSLGGSFGKGLRFFEPTSSTPTKRKQIWSQGEAEGNKYWFPCHNALNDLRTSEFFATVDTHLTVISNGNFVSKKAQKGGKYTFHYKTNKPYPNYLTAFVVGEYTELVQMYEGKAFHTFCYPDEKKAAEATTVRLTDMEKYFSGITGITYPYSSYSQVMVQDYPFPSLTGQNGFSTISDNMIDDYGTHADFLYLWDGVESDALASQWFGNCITPQKWNDIWLIKSFSHYLDGLYTDHKNGHAEYLMWYHPYDMGLTLGDWVAGYRHPMVTQYVENVETFVGDNYAKYRGALVLRMLEKEIGEKKWRKIIQHFCKKNKNKSVITADLQASIQAITGEKYDWFFEQWIYKMGHPIFEVSQKYDANKKQLSLTLKQTQIIDKNDEYPQVAFFRGKMQIEINNQVETIVLQPKYENTFTFSLPQAPRFVNVDYENTWIKEMTFEKSFEAYLAQFQEGTDILGRNEALFALAEIAKNDTTSAKSKTQIYTAFRNIIAGKSYWRLRMTAVSQLNIMLPKPIDEETAALFVRLIKQEKSWLKATAISALGATENEKYAELYISCLNDTSDRVVLFAAIALGKTKNNKAYTALLALKERPSWKSQSVMSSLAGLAKLGDARGAELALQALSDNQSPRWFLGNAWDYPFVAAQTLKALGKSELGYPIVFERFKKSMAENDLNDIFQQVLLITTLADPRGQEVFDMLKTKFKDDANTMTAVNAYQMQFKEGIKNEK